MLRRLLGPGQQDTGGLPHLHLPLAGRPCTGGQGPNFAKVHVDGKQM